MRRTLIASLALAAAALHLWAAGWSPLTALIQRPVHLALLGALGFLGVSARGGTSERSRMTRAADYLLITALFASCAYIAIENEALVRRAGTATTADLVAAAAAVLVVLELTRRTVGWGLVSVALLALAYSQAGPWLPGALAHRGYGPSRVLQHLYLGTEGLWGVPLGVSADFVYLFVLFGALLEGAGGGRLLIDLANRLAGGSRGGPAKTAALASAFMGSLSGSAVANVVTTGSMTIPLMKRAGFRPTTAAAIEAAASTGGQLMPPVMGAGAFILATWTNIPYIQVAMAALLPAALYYIALLAGIHFAAHRGGLELTRVAGKRIDARRLILLVPLAVIVAMLAFGRSPMRAAFWGIATAMVVIAVRSRLADDKVSPIAILESAARGSVQVAAACATAGIVVGVATLTGIGLRMSGLIVSLSGGMLPLALLLTAIVSVVLGMGLPTTAAYVVLAALGAPALEQLGAPLLASHLFIFYFGCISNVTPPVSLAAYAAAGLAGSPPVRTAIAAMGLAATGFIVPFAFVLDPALLLQGSAVGVGLRTVAAAAGVVALAAAAVGHHTRPLPTWERLALAAAAIALLGPGWVGNLSGGAVVTASALGLTSGRRIP
jgi:TRAP transporter 4TM/12TM fusion protein